MRRLTVVAGITLLVAVLPGAAQASSHYRFCSPASANTTYVLAAGHMPCGSARSLERVALHGRVLRNGPDQLSAWWSALHRRWQTASLGKRTSGVYRGTWMYGIWSSRSGATACPTVYFFLRHPLRTSLF